MAPEVSLIKTALTLLGVLALAIHAQAPPSPIQLETETVKVHPMTPGTYLIKDFAHAPPYIIPNGPRYTDTVHIHDLLMEAFGIVDYQILYQPAWASARDGYVYDIEVKAKGDATPTPAQMQQMLQQLLVDKFHLKTHWETKPKFSIYELTPDKGGPKFHAFEPSKRTATFDGTTIFALARFLSQNMDFPATDATGLKEVRYDFDINKLLNLHEEDREEANDPNAAQDYLRSAVFHQLGLKMDLKKVPMQMLAIDHIDEPPM